LKQSQELLAGVESENKVLGQRVDKLEYELDKYRGRARIVYLPANLSGNIIASDPKWEFVVVDVGENQGVKEDGELLVSRGGKLVAKLKIMTVQKDRSVANVVPGWKIGEVMEGDQVIPAHPAS
jgi:cell shape-determining protein MreC